MLLLILVALVALPASATVPRWPATWNMPRSTIIQACNYSGYLDPVQAATWGVVDLDWSNGKALWANTKPMDCEERLISQVNSIRAANNNTITWIYRNLVKALPWFTSVREKITDPAYSGWFLKYKDGINGTYRQPPCTYEKCSEFYHDQLQTPEHPQGDGSCVDECDCGSVPCGEYLWDHRNASLRTWLVDEFVMNNITGAGNPLIKGFYFDDGWIPFQEAPLPWWPAEGYCSGDQFGGPTEEYANCTVDMGLTREDVLEITAGWLDTIARAQRAVVLAGGFSWQQFHVENAPSKDTCSEFFRRECKTSGESLIYESAWFMSFTNGNPTPQTGLNEDMATFLLARGPYAWLGWGWIGCTSGSAPLTDKYPRPAPLDVDYGEPTERCHEGKPGVFSREWTKATATMDCNSFTGSVVMK